MSFPTLRKNKNESTTRYILHNRPCRSATQHIQVVVFNDVGGSSTKQKSITYTFAFLPTHTQKKRKQLTKQ